MDLNTTEEKRSKKVRLMLKPMFDSLPYEIVWEILIRVPAQDLFDFTMFVCKSWYGIINTDDFRYTHLRRSTPGYLVKNQHDSRASYMKVLTTRGQDGKIAFSKSSYNVPGYNFWSSCNGLTLESSNGNYKESRLLIITNPVTKQRFTLPSFFPVTAVVSPRLRSAIAYAATSMVYKVIATSLVDGKDPVSGRFCAVFTVGVDTSWRLVDTQHLSVSARSLLLWRPFVTEGFVHWSVFNSTSILTMNVETENITEIRIPRPKCYLPLGIKHYYPSMVRSSPVSVFICLDYFKWEVWEMKPKTGEWTKMPGIDLVARMSAINRCLYEYDGSVKPDGRLNDWNPYPVIWLKYPEIIFFSFCYPKNHLNQKSQSGFRAAYDLRTGNIRCYDMVDPHQDPLVHSNSLIRI